MKNTEIIFYEVNKRLYAQTGLALSYFFQPLENAPLRMIKVGEKADQIGSTALYRHVGKMMGQALSFQTGLSDINRPDWLNKNKRQRLMQIITDVIKTMSPEQWAYIYVDCVLYEEQTGENLEREKEVILQIAAGTSSVYRIDFVNRVIAKFQEFNETDLAQDTRVMLQSAEIKFKRLYPEIFEDSGK